MKHGRSRSSKSVPVVTIAPKDCVFEKMIGNMTESRRAGGRSSDEDARRHQCGIFDPSQRLSFDVPQRARALHAIVMRGASSCFAYDSPSSRLRRHSAQKLATSVNEKRVGKQWGRGPSLPVP